MGSLLWVQNASAVEHVCVCLCICTHRYWCLVCKLGVQWGQEETLSPSPPLPKFRPLPPNVWTIATVS